MNLTRSIFRFYTTFEITLLKVLSGFSHFEAVSTDKSVHWCPAHYRLTQTSTPLFTMFVGADSLNNAGMMEVRGMPACIFLHLCEGFHSILRVPVCKTAVLKTKGEKKPHWRKNKRSDGEERRGESSKSSLWLQKHTHYVQSWIIWHENTNLALDLQYTDSQLRNIHTLVGIFRCFLLV